MNVREWNVSQKVFKNRIFSSWKTLKFGLSRSWKVLEISGSVSVRTLVVVFFPTKLPITHVTFGAAPIFTGRVIDEISAVSSVCLCVSTLSRDLLCVHGS